MDANLAQELIDALRANTRALQEMTAAVAAAGTGAGGAKKAGAKEGKQRWERVRVKALARDWPNAHGWYKAKIGLLSTAQEEWFDTKSKSIAELLLRARENDLQVTITFDEKKNGQYVNRHLMTVEIADEGAAPAEEPKPRGGKSAPPVEEEEPLEESPF